jgi:hypothetical protein
LGELAVGSLAYSRHLADHLVAGGHAGPVRRQVALGHVQVGAADTAGQDAQQQLAWSWPRDLVIGVQAQRVTADRPGLLHMPRTHTRTLPRGLAGLAAGQAVRGPAAWIFKVRWRQLNQNHHPYVLPSRIPV